MFPCSVDEFPVEDHKHKALALQKRSGGNVRNLLEVSQQLIARDAENALPLTLIAAFPSVDCVDTQFIQHSLKPRIDFSHCVYREDFQTAQCTTIIRCRKSDSRTGLRYNGVPDITRDEFLSVAEAIAPRTSLYHFEDHVEARLVH